MWRKRVRYSAVEAVQVTESAAKRAACTQADYDDIFEFRSILLDGLLACFDTARPWTSADWNLNGINKRRHWPALWRSIQGGGGKICGNHWQLRGDYEQEAVQERKPPLMCRHEHEQAAALKRIALWLGRMGRQFHDLGTLPHWQPPNSLNFLLVFCRLGVE
jgi:hypothetical protein